MFVPIRTLMIDGEPWFVAADVCKAVGYGIKSNGQVNVSNALRLMSADETDAAQISTNSRGGGTRYQNMRLISESGLYKLVMRSDKPQAKKFQDWVTRDVLPTIRKTGQYNVHAAKVASGEMSLTEMTMKVLEGLQEQLRMEQEKVNA